VAKVSKAGGKASDTAVGAIVGTPLYMAPEQALGLTVDARADVYSLGLMLHELLTGKQTFLSASAMETVSKQINTPAPPLPRSVPASLRQLIARMLQKQPEQRPATIAEVLATLERTFDQKASVLPKWAMAAGVAVAVALGVVAVKPGPDSTRAAPPAPVAKTPPPPRPPVPAVAKATRTGTEPQDPESLLVRSGHTVELRIPDLTGVTVADPATAQVEQTPNGVRVTGKAAGYTTLLISTKTGETSKAVNVK
jgi:serine/threonine-protein kinase